MTEPDPTQEFARVKLNGDRFVGARLPVSAMSELENYTNLIREAAKLAWRDDHPGVELPDDFGADFDLVLTSVHNGSADCHLERLRPHLGDEEDYFDQSRERVGRELRQVLQGRVEEADDLLARIDAFGELGSSLETGDSLELPSEDAEEPVRITRSTYREFIRPAHERSLIPELPEIEKEVVPARNHNGWLVGRLNAINADTSRFDITTEKYGRTHGLYSDPEILDDLRAVLGTSQQAPIIRVYGLVQFRAGGKIFRMRDARDVQLLEVDGEPWSRRFIELANLESGWDEDDPDSEPISFAALDGARKLLTRGRVSEKPRPGIFPQADGGVSLEWSSPEKVYSIEISPDGDNFHLFYLDPEDREINLSNVDVKAAEAFISSLEFP